MSCLLGVAAGLGAVYYTQQQVKDADLASPVGLDPTGMSAQIVNVNELDENRLREILKQHAYSYSTVSGHYLSGRFAQRNHDWRAAEENLQKVIEKTEVTDIALMKRTMVLAMGAGDYETAMKFAKIIDQEEPQDEQASSALSKLFLALEAFKKQDYEAASNYVHDMPSGSLSAFIMPLLYSWTSAALDQYDVAELTQSSVHIHHAIMISDFLGKHDQITSLLDSAIKAPNLGNEDLERIADIYAHIGESDPALEIYSRVLATSESAEQNKAIEQKIINIKDGNPDKLFSPIRTPEEGVAKALFDMALILGRDFSDESARVFNQMALYINPDLTDARFLMAELSARNGHEHEAISIFHSIKIEDGIENYIKARKQSAELQKELGKTEQAVAELEELYKLYKDVDALIQIGDIYRHVENYEDAITSYNEAAKSFEDGIPAEYWHLYYVRGMSYEQTDQWELAERDLNKALEYQPDHPFVLNYLGYAWADQGEKLDTALELIERAASLRPMDGYIIDSLGWVQYRMGLFDEAAKNLEKAVELRPYDPVINDHLGDAYWRVGRKLEAKFQWERAKNHAEEDEIELKDTIALKLVEGLPALKPSDLKPTLQAARSE